MTRAYVIAAVVVLMGLVGVPRAVSAQSAFAVRISVTTSGGAARLGSGFVVELRDKRATIVTASHVTQDAKTISVAFAVDVTEPLEVAPADRLADEFDNPDGLSVFIVRGQIPAGVVALRSDPVGVFTAGETLTVVGFPQGARTVITNRPTYAGANGRLRVLGAAMGEGGSGSAVVRNGQLVGIVTTEQGARTNFVTARSVEDMVSSLGIALADAPAPAAAAAPAPVTTPSPASPVPAPTPPSPRAVSARTNPEIHIPGGTFLMGSLEADRGDEKMQHQVTLSPFRMQEHEVTNDEYRRKVPNHAPGEPGDLPVVNVTWHEAMDYAAWLGGSLPTEAQWEFAARGAAGRRYPWGQDPPTCARSNFTPSTLPGAPPAGECGKGLLPGKVGRERGRTPEGVYDLAGNVWEWVRDWHALYATENQTDPLGPPSGSYRVMRGGSYGSYPSDLTGYTRMSNAPDIRDISFGFRVAWSSAGGLD